METFLLDLFDPNWYKHDGGRPPCLMWHQQLYFRVKNTKIIDEAKTVFVEYCLVFHKVKYGPKSG